MKCIKASPTAMLIDNHVIYKETPKWYCETCGVIFVTLDENVLLKPRCPNEKYPFWREHHVTDSDPREQKKVLEDFEIIGRWK